MNIECDQAVRDELESAFRFNDAVIRNLIMKRDEAITEMSALAKEKAEESEARPRAVAEEENVVADEGDESDLQAEEATE
jgi:small subunit ribosomal protein S6